MSQNYYDIYLNSTFELAETLVIKSTHVADKINQHMSLAHGPGHYDPQDATTWKYYLNMSGEYHPLDGPIQITSLDTLETIVFSKQNLQIHRATAQAYQYGSRYYRELVTQYPLMEELILGVLYPVDLAKAIAAPDMRIVGYPPHLIEENEATLLMKINEWLEHFDIRWNNKAFVLSDELYFTSVLGLIALNLVPAIMNLRLKACHTDEAHSFHVRQYLASHGMLDRYLDQMTRKQAMFFYRNIRYIERNNGKQDIFEWLIQKVMTDRNLPLSRYTMKHDASVMPNSLTPAVTFRKRLINTEVQSQDRRENYRTLTEILNKEEPLAPGNQLYRRFNEASIMGMFEQSISSTVATKVLESSVVDYTDAVPITLHRVMMSNWIYLSHTDRFNALVRVTNPRNGEVVSLTARDAYYYYLYAFCKASGLNLETVPSLIAERVHVEPVPTTTEILSVVDTQYVTQTDALFLLAQHPPLQSVSSTAGFQDHARELHEYALRQLRYVANQEHEYTRGLMHNAVLRMHSDTVVNAGHTGDDYLEWLDSVGMPHEEFTPADWEAVYRNVYESVTGLNLRVTENIGNLQKAMVALMAQLSSYSIQFVSEINSASVQVVDWAAIRLGDMSSYGKNFWRLLISVIRFEHVRTELVLPFEVPLGDIFQDFHLDVGTIDFGQIEVPIDVVEKPVLLNHRHNLLIGQMVLDHRYTPEDHLLNSWSQVPNFSGFYAMTEEEKQDVKSVYGTCFPPMVIPTHADIRDLILVDHVPGFQYVPAKRTYLNMFKYFYLPKSTYLFINSGIEVELDAFYPHYGDLDSTGFELNTGNHFATSFEYDSGLPPQTDATQFQYSGGYTFGTVFDPTLSTDEEAEVGGFHNTAVEASPVIMPVNWSGSLLGFISTSDIRSLPPLMGGSVEVGREDELEGLNSVHAGKSLPAWTGTTARYDFNWLSSHGYTQLNPFQMVNGVKDIGTLESLHGNHETSDLRSMHQVRSLGGMKNTAVIHHTRGVQRFITTVANLSNMSFIRAVRNLNGVKNTYAVRSMPNFTVTLHRRSINAFNYMLGSGEHDVVVVNTYSKLTITWNQTYHRGEFSLVQAWRDDELQSLETVHDLRDVGIVNTATSQGDTAIIDSHHVWELADIDAP